jgi:sarcosine oxidase subunit alpha
LEAILLEGQLMGLQAAARGGYRHGEAQLPALKARLKSAQEVERTPTPAQVRAEGSQAFICFCEDVTAKDLHAAIAEGFDDIQTLKRYSTISMGPTQGKVCTVNTIKLLARAKGQRVAETGTTTSRPPYTPVKLGTLAGRALAPVRRTPMHAIHIASGATMMNAGQWKRPEHYGDPHAEVQAVRRGVGIIDVSTLGKIDVRGPDAPALLERVYTGTFAGMAPGQLRYGLMCTEEGIIFDDGVVARLAEERFYLTTTSGGAQRVYEWITWWAAVWGLRVHIRDQTANHAAINLAGPHTRELLSPLTDIDLSKEAFPYMRTRQGHLAGVPARLMRVGFVGELGYEIHLPAAYGAHLWETLTQAGAAMGLSPFGIEAQRVLRLEKGHIIVGQDTNALSDPYGAKLGWAVELDKPDFIGKPSLSRRAQVSDDTSRELLAGFEMAAPTQVPREGEQFVQEGKLVGRVTSARYSPTMDKAIGLGWLIPEAAALGSQLTLRTNGHLAPATVVDKRFYDPGGDRLKV